MDKETLSNYGWIVICVLVMVVMIALATPFGSFISEAVQSTTKGLFDVNKSALDSTGLINIDNQEFDVPDMNHGAGNGGAGQTPVTPQPTIITFTIDGIEYNGEEGMTWAQWVESDYNTIGLFCFEGTETDVANTVHKSYNTTTNIAEYLNTYTSGWVNKNEVIQASQYRISERNINSGSID